ncbi:MAG: Unknown protein [uncultured Thiotrichaceae bacterium]|uniref:Multidrug resistance protein MdtA-like C-terminal permuted SH3 domain-containing protein n=1 Tax=uncultured Thiotrichaceae bacterium TaxID=298394 RepID=A0A6S6TBY2_9GAMM|nr:MAG: Unknown protein [uncultured Thiotrichaceae bacterium]
MKRYSLLTILALYLGLLPSAIQAGAEHDHGNDNEPALVNANAPQRLPDGRVFLPKNTQRFIQVRTQIVNVRDVAKTRLLNGTIIRQTNAKGKLLAPQNGQFILSRDLPQIGDSVKQGQQFGTISLSQDAQEQTNQAAALADLKQQLKLAKLEKSRLSKLGNLIPKQEVDAAANTVQRINAQISAYQGGQHTSQSLTIPQSGIVNAIYVNHQQSVQTGDLLLEIIDPKQVMLEGLSYDPLLPTYITSASVSIDEKTIPLQYQGTNGELRQQALPLRFTAIKDKSNYLTNVPIGLPVQIAVQTQQKIAGIPVPIQSLAKNASNQSIVWIKVAPEHYQPREVVFQPLDGKQVVITAGLKGGERVVTEATTLINQIR